MGLSLAGYLKGNDKFKEGEKLTAKFEEILKNRLRTTDNGPRTNFES